ncbi:Thioesterase/thiol ester dehydrase-isomerase [Xylona heveae TC161]|uniref:Thioesterase/thiol ester dehydrase-isomerase n=1 Tax=Xylona heveae (strain CBS 132557 / TC161) TaxID=1328760 RepID=A0A165JX29_XYLHT|nr:Thioesterase/thiol ester dehydrase-isomerase [Xylona heveae TC161]KZF26731.1 Thioesterase/thiol ester dehydrase-isomerase [Xylona heveae TC161]
MSTSDLYANRVAFAQLMALEQIPGQSDSYRNVSKPHSPGGFTTAFGGHVYAQAVYAASKTIKEGYFVHNVTGFFTSPVMVNLPLHFTVTRIKDGGLVCTRSVNVSQPGGADNCFTCICSFKRNEKGSYEHQEDTTPAQKYAKVLDGKKPEDHKFSPAVDIPWYWEIADRHNFPDVFSGMDVRKVDMTPYNQGRPPYEYRQLQYYRAIGAITANDPHLHACAHLYASDRNSLFVLVNALGIKDYSRMASISHSVVFHLLGDDLLMYDADGKERWYLQEAWTGRTVANRGTHESKIWDAAGRHIASTWQDGLLKTAGSNTQSAGLKKAIEAQMVKAASKI